MGQFLTAVFELHPTRRKAVALERVRALNEEVFWEFMDAAHERADAILTLPKKVRRKAVWEVCKPARPIGFKHNLACQVIDGLQRDVEQTVSSYVALKLIAIKG